MIVLDTDILTLALHGDAGVGARLDAVPIIDQGVPVVALEEVLRGRMAAIRQADTGKGKVSLAAAYELLARALADTHRFRVVPFTPPAELLVAAWRKSKLRLGTRDLRIAATTIIHGATLATRNRRDFEQVPGLMLEVWT